MVVNAARPDEDFAWLQKHLKEGRSPDRPSGGLKTAAVCEITNRSANFGGVAIQGPRIAELFHALFGAGINLPPRNSITDFRFDGTTVSVVRTGYTGEDGIEVFFRSPDAVRLWYGYFENGRPFGITPSGLGPGHT